MNNAYMEELLPESFVVLYQEDPKRKDLFFRKNDRVDYLSTSENYAPKLEDFHKYKFYKEQVIRVEEEAEPTPKYNKPLIEESF